MSRDAQPDHTRPFSIPWWKTKKGLSSLISTTRLSPAVLDVVEGTTLYKDWLPGELADPAFIDAGYGNHVFGGWICSPTSGPAVFLWLPPPAGEPDDDGFVQELADEWDETRDVSWPPVLHELRVLRSEAAVQVVGNGISGNKVIQRRLWTDGQTVRGRVKVQVYASIQQPPRRLLKSNEPRPTSLRGDWRGDEVYLPACLHGRVTLPTIAANDAEIYNATPDASQRLQGTDLEFEKTNHIRWQKYSTVQVEKDPESRLWRRTKFTFFPPPHTYTIL